MTEANLLGKMSRTITNFSKNHKLVTFLCVCEKVVIFLTFSQLVIHGTMMIDLYIKRQNKVRGLVMKHSEQIMIWIPCG
jgi:hypothetical protein